ncbi:MAG: B12-binding domain-containing radical SAM protein [Desulfomonilaceae bacterium]
MANSTRTVLVNPPWYCFQNQPASYLPLGIAYIAGVLTAAGHEVQIVNGEQLLAPLTIDPSIQRPGIVVSSIERYESFHDPNSFVWKILAKEILASAPRIVGFSMWTASYQSVINTAMVLKELDPNIITVVGGIHPTIDPLSVINHPVVDFVICGEGEQAAPKLWELISTDANFQRESTKIEGVWTKLNGEVWNGGKSSLIDRIDDIPFPNYEVVKDLSVQSIAGIITSRGCPFGCSFCASEAMWTKRVRYREIGECIRELAYYRSKFDLRKFRVNDDTFCLNRDRVKEFCDQLVALFGHTWEFMVDANVNSLDSETVSFLKMAGCTQINFGIESVAPRIRQLFINKKVDLDHAKKMVEEMYRVGIISSVYFMTGFPGETEAELEATILFMEELGATNNIWSIVSPYPGTSMYEYCIANGYLRKVSELHLMHHSLATNMAAIDPKRYGALIRLIEGGVGSLLNRGHFRLEHVVDRINTDTVATIPWSTLNKVKPLTDNSCGCVDELVLRDDGEVAASGWAYNPLLFKPAECVVIFVEGRSVGITKVRYERPDVANALGDKRLQRTGWKVIMAVGNAKIAPSSFNFVAVSDNLPVGFLENRFNQTHCGRDVGL